MQNRDKNIDSLKGIAILLVVLGHVIQVVYEPETYDQNLVFKVIYSFHMPLFMFVNGYLIAYKERLDLKWLKGRFLRLVIPFIVWIPIDYILDGGKTLDGLFVCQTAN